jgi:uroporphyrinogen decarboxylase
MAANSILQATDIDAGLGRKERVRRALRREPVDRLPTQINYTGKMGRILAGHFGVPEDEVPDRLGNHLLRVDITYDRRLSEDGTVAFDWWGAGWDTRTEGYWHSFAPMKDPIDLDVYPWPDPGMQGLMDSAERAIRDSGSRYFVAPNFGMCLFERAWSLRGFDALLMDMIDRPEWVSDLLDRITAIQVALAKRFVAARVDAGYFGDDYGAQRSMLFSPRLWRRFMKPRLAAMFAVFLDAGLPVILHSDGDIRAILPDLIEIGLTTLNPVQPEVMEHGWLCREFGSRLSFFGGISTQAVLPAGNAAAVREATLACARNLAQDRTGLLLGPSHRMQSDIPPRSVDAMLEAFREA